MIVVNIQDDFSMLIPYRVLHDYRRCDEKIESSCVAEQMTNLCCG